MENKEYTGKRILTDEELEKVSGGTDTSGVNESVPCKERLTKEDCEKKKCQWKNDKCYPPLKVMIIL